MEKSLKTGFSFGITSGVITTLGLMVGLHSGTHSKLAVIGGILTIAIADAFSDALGIHISEEAKDKQPQKQIWLATTSTFLTKLVFALTFIIPILIFELLTAMIVSVIWGLLILGIFSFLVARTQRIKPARVILEHLLIVLMVIMITHFVGEWIALRFN